jgi:hypothetical protein
VTDTEQQQQQQPIPTSTPTLFALIISSADYSNCFDETETSYEKNQLSFLLAKRCMRVVDFDRLIHICHRGHPTTEEVTEGTAIGEETERIAREEERKVDEGQEVGLTDYIFRMTSLFPLTCSPKNNVIIGRCLSNK